jgi:tRNA(adenine34) deaminase
VLEIHRSFMERALELACQAWDAKEVPVGAVLVHQGKIVLESRNRMREYAQPWAHAEMLLLQGIASHTRVSYLHDYSLYVTLEPCIMCAAALALVRVGAIYFGAYDAKRGGIDHGCRIFDGHQSFFKPPVVVSGIYERKCQAILKRFFYEKRGSAL